MRFLRHRVRSLHPLLVALLILVFIMRPLSELDLLIPHHGTAGVTLLVVLAGMFGLLPEAGNLRTLLVVSALITMALLVATIGLPPLGTHIAATAAAVVSLSLLALAVLKQALAPGKVTLRRIEGAVIAYLLLGLVFAGAFDLVEVLSPGAFLENGVPLDTHALTGDFVFFSFITLTSTGYGDQVPVHPAAKSLAVLEAICGQLYMAVLLARLVSLELMDRER